MDIREFLKIEEDGSILKYRVTEYQIPLWLFIRSEIGLFYLPNKLFGMEPRIKFSLSNLSFKEKLEYITRTLTKNCFRSPKSDIVIFGYSINNVLENEHYVNRLYDPFCFAFQDKILLIEGSDRLKYPNPRLNRKVLYTDIIPVISRLLSRFVSLPKEDINIISEFVVNLRDKIDSLFAISFSDFFELTEYLINILRRINIRIWMYQMLLQLTRPKLIIIEDACYGGLVDLICMAKKLKIKVAEYQHGFIGPNHFAYNYHPNVHSTVKPYLPDYMLFWGEYWARSTSIPLEKIVIGFPYIEEKAKNTIKENAILLISSGMMPREVIDFGSSMINALDLKKYRFIFRPHPSERVVAAERYKHLMEIGYELDTGNLYETLRKIDICISLEISTVLYEAVYFNCKTFLKTTPLTLAFKGENLPFETFDELSDLLDLLEKAKINKQDQLFFANNSIDNFKEFLIQHIY